MVIRGKYKNGYEGEDYKNPIFKQGGFSAEWCGSYKEIRIFGRDEVLLVSIPSHGRWIQLGSTVKKVGDLKTIYELAKKSVAEVYTR